MALARQPNRARLCALKGSLVTRPFDAGRLELTGEAVPVVKEIVFTPGNAQAHFPVSKTGVLLCRSACSNGGGPRHDGGAIRRTSAKISHHQMCGRSGCLFLHLA